jgi:solute carrier family 25 (adenine nucleotide translocator) protein 4/5/6/31
VREEGVNSLWRGNMANIYRYFPTQAIAFGVKDQYNRIFNPYNSKTNPYKFFFGSLLSGGLAGATSMTIVYPLDFARTRLG